MPEEPHKPIEDALKAYAKQRREAAGGPLDMPSHTRAVLQREIGQRAAAAQPKPAARPWFEPLVALWPRLAVGAAAVAAVGIVMLVLTDIGQKAKPPLELAQAETQSQSLFSYDRSGQEEKFGRKFRESEPASRGVALTQSRASDTVEQLHDERMKPTDSSYGAQTASNWAAAQSGRADGDKYAAGGSAFAKLKAGDKLDGLKVAAKAELAKEMPEVPAMVAGVKLQVAAMPVPAPPAAAPMPEPAPVLPAKPSPVLASTASPAALVVNEPKPVAAKPAEVVAMQAAIPAPTLTPPPAAAPAAPATPAPADADKGGRADTSRLVTAAVSNMTPLSQRLRFAQVATDDEAEPAKRPRQQQPQPPQVLASFQLEQTGERVVITDADGSVYEGRIQQASAEQQQVATDRRASRSRSVLARAAAPRQVMTQAGEFVWKERTASPGRRLESGAAGQQLYFTASGMNRSVNQRIVVNGVLSSPADGTLAYSPVRGADRMSFDAAFAAKDSPMTSSARAAVTDSNAVLTKASQITLPAGTAGSPVPAAPQASAQIEGTLRVGDAAEVELNAVGVGP